MSPDQYIIESERTAAVEIYYDNVPKDILHAIIGISTEGGESLDAVKAALFYNKPLDMVNLDEEMGDKLWYIAMYCRARKTSFGKLMDSNIKKLRVRYPDKFTELDAVTRDLFEERKALEP